MTKKSGIETDEVVFVSWTASHVRELAEEAEHGAILRMSGAQIHRALEEAACRGLPCSPDEILDSVEKGTCIPNNEDNHIDGLLERTFTADKPPHG